MTTMRLIHKYTCKRGLDCMRLCAILVLVGGVNLSTFVTSSPTPMLTPHYYNASCPSLPFLVRASMTAAVQREARMAASIIRLFFHDCFVQVMMRTTTIRLVVLNIILMNRISNNNTIIFCNQFY